MTGVTGPGRPPPSAGETRIADRVVAKIAAQAAKEAVDERPEDADAPRGHRHRAPRRPPGYGSASTSAYPSDIGRSAARCVVVSAERVRALAGMEVPEVAVQVERLHSVGSGQRTGGEHPMTEPQEPENSTRRLPTRRVGAVRRCAGDGPVRVGLRATNPPPHGRSRAAGPAASGPGAGSPRPWSPSSCSGAAGLLLYDVAAVRADHPAMQWRRTARRRPGEPSPRRRLGARGVGAGGRTGPLAAPPRAHPRTARPAADAPPARRCTGRARPDRRRPRPAGPGHGGGRGAVRTGEDGPAQGDRARPLALPGTRRRPGRPGRRPGRRPSASWAWPGRPASPCTCAGRRRRGERP